MLEAAFGIPVWQNVMEDMRIQHEVQPVKQWVKLHDKHREENLIIKAAEAIIKTNLLI